MKKMRFVIVMILILIASVGVCGCMNRKNNKLNRKESDQEYIVMMQQYIKDKYSITVDVVEYIFPKEGFNTELKQNILVVKDNNGVLFNIRARLGTPYKFYDDYVQSCTARSIQEDIGINLSSSDNRIYVVINNYDISNIDISATNIESLIFVAMIYEEPCDATLEKVYEIYNKLQNREYKKIRLIVGFTESSEEFKKVAENYTVYGKEKWEDYLGKVYANLVVSDKNLSFDEFKEKIK